MHIGIIGTGNIGSALTRRLRDLNHAVLVANSRGPQTLADLARQTGATAVTVEEATRNRDVVIVTIPEKCIRELPTALFEGVSESVVVIDTGNYHPQQRDGLIEAIEYGITESRWVANWLCRPVVQAFDNIYAQHLLKKGQPTGTAG